MIHVLSKAEAYYQAMKEKDLEEVAKYLHPDVKFKSPVRECEGKVAFLAALQEFTASFEAFSIRAIVGAEDQKQAVVIYDPQFPLPIGVVRTAGFLTFDEEGLIISIELFFDLSPFIDRRN